MQICAERQALVDGARGCSAVGRIDLNGLRCRGARPGGDQTILGCEDEAANGGGRGNEKIRRSGDGRSVEYDAGGFALRVARRRRYRDNQPARNPDATAVDRVDRRQAGAIVRDPHRAGGAQRNTPTVDEMRIDGGIRHESIRHQHLRLIAILLRECRACRRGGDGERRTRQKQAANSTHDVLLITGLVGAWTGDGLRPSKHVRSAFISGSLSNKCFVGETRASVSDNRRRRASDRATIVTSVGSRVRQGERSWHVANTAATNTTRASP